MRADGNGSAGPSPVPQSENAPAISDIGTVYPRPVTGSPPPPEADAADAFKDRGSAIEVFIVFLKLGLTSFGGPLAHLGYFHREFVQRRRWLDDARFAQLLTVCQFLPGPASSQMGLAIGLFRGGWRGALAAFAAFTLPSALLMLGFAAAASRLHNGVYPAVIHGLKLVAVAVVAHGLVGMARQLLPDMRHALITCLALAVAVLAGNAWGSLIAVGLGGLLGMWLCTRARAPVAAVFPVRYGARGAAISLALFAVGLAASLALPSSPVPTGPRIAGAFYQAGALVFGGGHVVLPLLQHAVVDSGWVGPDTFLAGYGAAQAMPGPMFSLAAFLGAESSSALPAVVGAGIALLAIFLPGFLLLLSVLPIWNQLVRRQWAARAVAGAGAAVVGLLAAAFHDPVWTEGVRAPSDLAIAAVGFALLAVARVSAAWVVLWCVAAALAVQRLM